MRTRIAMALVLGLCVATALASCGGGSSSSTTGGKGPTTVPYNGPTFPGGGSGPGDEIEAHRGLWEGLGIGSYDFTLQRTVFGPPTYNAPVVVQVRAGQVVSRTYATTGLPVAPQDAAWWPPIPGLFDLLEDARDRNADVLQITWNDQYGYPAAAEIDDDTGLGDDEHSFVVTNFAPR